MFYEPLTESIKKEIARLFNTNDLPVEKIASQLNVSVRTVYNFKDYGYEVEDNPQIQDLEKSSGHKTKEWICKRCGHITDKKGIICPYCQTGPFDSILVEIGSPQYQDFIRTEREKSKKKTESADIIFTPDRVEPRDPSKYEDPEPQDNEDSESQDNEEPGDENETDTTTKEETQRKFEWECPGCHHQWNGYMLECPNCGMKLQE